jgi:hypothetical protein
MTSLLAAMGWWMAPLPVSIIGGLAVAVAGTGVVVSGGKALAFAGTRRVVPRLNDGGREQT